MTANNAAVAKSPNVGFIKRTSTRSDNTIKFRLKFLRSAKSSPVASTNKSPAFNGSSPSLPGTCCPSRWSATIAALNLARKPSDLAVRPLRTEPGAISTSVNSLCIKPSRFAKVLRPDIWSSLATSETSPVNTKRSSGRRVSVGDTGVIVRPSRRISARYRVSNALSPAVSTLLPTKIPSESTSASNVYSLSAALRSSRMGKRLDKSTNKQPTNKTTGPEIPKKSPKLRPVPRWSSRKLLTIRLVEVPISVSVPPRMAA